MRTCSKLFWNHNSKPRNQHIDRKGVNLTKLQLFGLLLLAFVCFPTQLFSEQPNSERPNVLFIAIDDLNNVAAGLNPELRADTPFINALANRGTLFTNAHCAAPVCNPSRVSVMTGVAPITSGVYRNNQDWRHCSRLKGLPTLPKHFKNHGYKVLGGGKLYHAASLSEKMHEGYLDPEPWHDYFPSKSRQLPVEAKPSKFPANGTKQFYRGYFDWAPLDIEEAEMGDAKVVSWAEGQLGKRHDKPLFLAVGIYRPHVPWYTPKEWFDKYPQRSIELPRKSARQVGDIPEIARGMTKHAWHNWLVENEKWDDAVQAYLASASFADAMVGRLIKALDEGPLAKNTIVVLWSDHGYHLGHKQHWEKRVLWDQASHVPVIIVGTEALSTPKNSQAQTTPGRCNRPVSLLDLYPTLVDVCGLKKPQHLEGKSLKPFLTEPSSRLLADRKVVITHRLGNHAVRSENWRYIRYSDGSEELYDHRDDPGELNNLARDKSYLKVKQSLAAAIPTSWAPLDPAPKPRIKQIVETVADPSFVVSLSGENQIATYSIDESGKFKLTSKKDIKAKPAASRFDPNGKFLYVGCSAPESIACLRVEKDGLTNLQTVFAPKKPSYLEVDPTGRFLVASYYKTGQVTVHGIQEDGQLSEEPLKTYEGEVHAHGVAIAPSGKYVFIPHTSPNCIDQFKLDLESGELTPNDPPKLDRGEIVIGPRHLWFHPNGKLAYGSNEKGRSISAYGFEPNKGTLTHIQTLPSMPDDYSGKGTTSHVEVHPSGKFAFIANRGQGSLASFKIDQTSGKMIFVSRVPVDVATRSFNISPDGRFLVASDPKSNNMYCFKIGQDGKLIRTDSTTPGKGPWWISFFKRESKVKQ